MPNNYLSSYNDQQGLPTVNEYVRGMQAQVPQRMAPRQKTAMDYMLTAPQNFLQMLGMQPPADVAALDRRLTNSVDSMRERNRALRDRLNSFDQRRMAPSPFGPTQPRTL